MYIMVQLTALLESIEVIITVVVVDITLLACKFTTIESHNYLTVPCSFVAYLLLTNDPTTYFN